MSRKGNWWENAPMESFFGTVKEECVGSTIDESHDEARLAIFTYARGVLPSHPTTFDTWVQEPACLGTDGKSADET